MVPPTAELSSWRSSRGWASTPRASAQWDWRSLGQGRPNCSPSMRNAEQVYKRRARKEDVFQIYRAIAINIFKLSKAGLGQFSSASPFGTRGWQKAAWGSISNFPKASGDTSRILGVEDVHLGPAMAGVGTLKHHSRTSSSDSPGTCHASRGRRSYGPCSHLLFLFLGAVLSILPPMIM